MKNILIKLSPIILIFIANQLVGQDNSGEIALYKALIEQDRNIKNEQFKNPETSPLPTTDMESFKSLKYFETDSKYKVTAQLNVLEEQESVSLLTSDDKKMELIKYGTVTFTLEGKSYTLMVFRDQNLPELSENPGQLFIPFKDATSGKETNSNGRYIALSKSDDENVVEIDFNKAFNPYSAYSRQYISVIPPDDNLLEEVLMTGERKYEDR